ncbi:MAG TPA: hypothetical protein VNK52_12730 [Hyphomicrobiaceae bacterium]|nr:hypothetical protein [Hyphomicrobiaceae bacterium]
MLFLPGNGASGAVHPVWPEPHKPARGGLLFAQAGTTAKRAINIASTIVAEPAGEAPFSMQVVSSEALPSGSYIRIRGLPPLASMSEGFAIAPSLWAVPLNSLPKLRIRLPPKSKGQIALNIALVTVEGSVLVETKTTVAVGSQPAQPGPEAKVQPSKAPAPQSALPPVKLEQTPNAVASAIVPGYPTEPAPLPPDPQSAAEEQPLTPQQARALGFIARGQELFSEGNVSSARLLFKRAADTGLAYGALFLGQTYDPYELALYQVRGLGGDPAQAKYWYEKAYALGAPEADELIRRLEGRLSR